MSEFLSFQNLSAIATAVTAILVLRQLYYMRESSRQSLIIGLYGRTMSHNDSIVSSEHQRIVINISHDLEAERPALRLHRVELESQPNSYASFYWATRAVHLSHLFLIYQVWCLSGERKDVFEKEFYGWAIFARHILQEIHGTSDHFDLKPEWYKDACKDIRLYQTEAAGYSKKYFLYAKELITVPESQIGQR
jgi:hypothetical protein